MRLDFNVLWVDDQPNQLIGQSKAVGARMREQGFEFSPIFLQTLDAVQEQVRDQVFVDEVDLILVDWNLGAQLEGQDVIAEIRRKIHYKDVIFYSSYTNVKELRKHAYEVGAEGVYCASKNVIVDEIMEAFEALIKKVLDLDHTRGIVMGATSDIDEMVIDCLSGINRNSDAANQKKLSDKAKKIISTRIKETQKKANALANADSVVSMLEAHALFTANDRLRVLKAALEEEAYAAYKTLRSGLSNYINKVVPIRNDLGHVVLVPAGRPQAFASVDGREINIEEMRELRCFLLELRADFRKLRDDLRGLE